MNTTMSLKPVTRYTRAGHNGREIMCPECKEWGTVYHFNWYALTCIHCEKDINKKEWLVETRGDG